MSAATPATSAAPGALMTTAQRVAIGAAPAMTIAARPQAPLLDDDTDEPSLTDDVPSLAADEVDEVDPSQVIELDPPTSRIALRAELAADLLIDAPASVRPAPPPAPAPRLAPRPMRRGDSHTDEPDDTLAILADQDPPTT